MTQIVAVTVFSFLLLLSISQSHYDLACFYPDAQQPVIILLKAGRKAAPSMSASSYTSWENWCVILRRTGCVLSVSFSLQSFIWNRLQRDGWVLFLENRLSRDCFKCSVQSRGVRGRVWERRCLSTLCLSERFLVKSRQLRPHFRPNWTAFGTSEYVFCWMFSLEKHMVIRLFSVFKRTPLYWVQPPIGATQFGGENATLCVNVRVCV